jgi:hypothetical protein
MTQLGPLVLLCFAIVASSASSVNEFFDLRRPTGSSPASLMPRVNLSAIGPEVSRVALGILHLAQDPKVTSVADARAVLESASE